MDFSTRNEIKRERRAVLVFKPNDPGKRVDAHLPTPLWKMISEIAARDRMTIGHVAAQALSEWALKHE